MIAILPPDPRHRYPAAPRRPRWGLILLAALAVVAAVGAPALLWLLMVAK